MAQKTFIVTIEHDSPLSHLSTVLSRGGGERWSIASLDVPDLWPTTVWQAFERAQAARTEAFIANRASYQDQGHQLKHPATRYQAALAELGVEVALAEVEAAAFPVDPGRTPPHGDQLH